MTKDYLKAIMLEMKQMETIVKTNGLSYLEVEECIEKSSIILLENSTKTNGLFVRCISEDRLNGKTFIVNALDIERRGKRLFVNKKNIVGFVDNSIMDKKEGINKRLRGNLLNYQAVPEIEYLDNKTKSLRRS